MIDRAKALIGAATLAGVIIAFVYFAAITAQQNTLLSKQAETAVRTEQALCILRDDLQERIDTAHQFLEDHPDGIPGISTADIQQSIDNQQRTVTALALLQCSGVQVP